METALHSDVALSIGDEDPAAKIARLLEGHFDEMGWSEEERDRRVAQSSVRITDAVARARHPE